MCIFKKKYVLAYSIKNMASTPIIRVNWGCIYRSYVRFSFDYNYIYTDGRKDIVKSTKKQCSQFLGFNFFFQKISPTVPLRLRFGSYYYYSLIFSISSSMPILIFSIPRQRRGSKEQYHISIIEHGEDWSHKKSPTRMSFI